MRLKKVLAFVLLGLALVMVLSPVTSVKTYAQYYSRKNTVNISKLSEGDILDAGVIISTEKYQVGEIYYGKKYEGHFSDNGPTTYKIPVTCKITKIRVEGRGGARPGNVRKKAYILTMKAIVQVTDITIPDTIIMSMLNVQWLEPVVKPVNAANKSLIWSSSDTNVVTVSDKGLVRAVAPGKATITVTATQGTKQTYDDIKATTSVTVRKANNAYLKDSLARYPDYTGSEVVLITPAKPQNGTVYYAVQEDKPGSSRSGWSTSLPTAINPGKYRVWYKTVGEKNHMDIPPRELSVTIFKASAPKIKMEANKLIYNGKEQELVTAPQLKGGKLVYVIGKDKKSPPSAGYQKAIPKRKDAGSYFVWYKFIGDIGHRDSYPAVVEVTIAPKTVHLIWSDTSLVYNGKSQIPTVTLEGVIKGDTCEISQIIVDGPAKMPGVYTARATKLSNPNYSLPKENTVTFTIKKDKGSDPKKPTLVTGEDSESYVETPEKTEIIPRGKAFRGLKLYGKGENGNIKLKWDKYPGAAKYVVYGNRCCQKYTPKKIKTVTGTSLSVKVSSDKYQKYYVKALDSNDKVLSTSKMVYVAGKGYGNPTDIKLSRKKITVKAGETARVNGRMVTDSRGIKVYRQIRYESSNPEIAKVNEKTGEITGKKKGECYVYVYAQNGLYKKVSMKVK